VEKRLQVGWFELFIGRNCFEANRASTSSGTLYLNLQSWWSGPVHGIISTLLGTARDLWPYHLYYLALTGLETSSVIPLLLHNVH